MFFLKAAPSLSYLKDLKTTSSLQPPTATVDVEPLELDEVVTPEKIPLSVPSSSSELQVEESTTDDGSKQEDPVIVQSESFIEAATDFEYAADIHDGEAPADSIMQENGHVEFQSSDIISTSDATSDENKHSVEASAVSIEVDENDPSESKIDDIDVDESNTNGTSDVCFKTIDIEVVESKMDESMDTEIETDINDDEIMKNHSAPDSNMNGEIDVCKSSEEIAEEGQGDVDLIIVRNLDDIVDASQIEMPNGFPVDEYLVINFAKDEWVYVTQKEKEGRITLDDRSMDPVELDI